MNMKLSKRITELPFSAIRKLIPYSDAAKERGKKVYHLNIGAPDVKTPQEFFEAIHKVDLDVLSYAPSPGLKELREAMSRYYKAQDIDFEADEIVVTNGGSEALYFSLLAVTDPGDEILTCEPYYANYFSYFSETSTTVRTFETKVEENFRLPAREKIEEKINDRTKAILLSNPGNPTGAVYTQEEVKMIADIALKHNLYILADEVYREFIFDDQEYLSFGSLDEVKDRVIIIDSISKRFSACGARIGCVASKNKEIMAAMVKLATVRLAAPTIEMVGATALYNLGEEYFDEIKEIYQSRRDCIYEELNKIEGVTSNRAGGAFYTIANLPVDDAEDFCIWLLEEFEVDGKTLMMAPAAGFYEHADDHKSEVRIAFILNNDDLKEAMRILDAGLKAYNNR